MQESFNFKIPPAVLWSVAAARLITSYNRSPRRSPHMRVAIVTLLCVTVGITGLLAQTPTRTLTIYYIDTEGGQSTLFVSPTGESLLVDTGNPGDRDLTRIVDALAAANVTKIDHLWTTHYHIDHVGGLEQLAKRLPIQHFYDHGKNVEAR